MRAAIVRRNFIAACAAAIVALLSFSCAAPGSHEGRRNAPLRGLYVPNRQANNPAFIRALVERGKPLGVNMLVLDVHPFMVLRPRISAEVVEYLKKEKIFITARVVCFQDGLGRLPVPEDYLDRLFTVVKAAAGAGFGEIQLDYIRFQDGGPAYSLAAKYGFVATLLRRAREITDAHGMILSADVFGRVVYNRNDIIGQQMELFARHVGVIYPMLYPSHFTGDRARMADPGETIREGIMKGMARVRGTGVLIQPYIQAFPYNIRWARVTLDRYVEMQVIAAESTGARGWVAWNAKGDYESVFRALERL
ncbi:MAG: hypothetical protein E4G96_07450 [Chrysiogenales bacterium]|nr:MAG: hypothetical protein E4G96_07450 [Chrysiogenales bacterium]